jgi:hypothetical protein
MNMNTVSPLNRRRCRAFLILSLAAAAGTAVSHANERRFTYTYESAVLSPKERELELWSTYRTGRASLYSRLDHRLEWEWGLTDRLMTAFYFNWSDVTQAGTTPGSTMKSSQWKGISSEWKYKLSDPVADALGSALYGEATLGTDEVELEGKLILDKRWGRNLLAFNAVVEGEWEREPGGLEYEETAWENVLGVTRFFTPRFAAGFEVRNHNEFNTRGRAEHAALFAGPVVSYGGDGWWLAFSVLPQLPPLKKSAANPQDNLVLDEHERVNARLLLAFHF